jgi:hypothetical protein
VQSIQPEAGKIHAEYYSIYLAQDISENLEKILVILSKNPRNEVYTENKWKIYQYI